MQLLKPVFTASLIGLMLVGCGGSGGGSEEVTPTQPAVTPSTTAPAEYVWDLPLGLPTPKQQADNPMSEVKVELGRLLFYDTRMSANDTQSCGSCHHQNKAFTDGLTTSIGSTGDVHPRNSMSLTNAVYNSAFNWANPVIKTLPDQAFIPMMGEFPIELGWSGHEAEILDRFRFDAVYQDVFSQAFPDEAEPITAANVAKAVSAFVSTLLSGNSAYDKNLYQNQADALSDSAKRGRDLFFSERLECFHCHGGFNFSQSVNHAGTVFDETEFHNNGLYNIGGTGAFPADNRGLWEFTFIDEDMGRFRAPTLRNIELTAPYMHDGSMATLEAVLAHYMRGGQEITEGEFAGDGAKSPFKSELIVGFVLTEQEKQDVLNFLKSLTDWTFICDERFSDPYGNIPPHPNCLTP